MTNELDRALHDAFYAAKEMNEVARNYSDRGYPSYAERHWRWAQAVEALLNQINYLNLGDRK